MYKFVTVGAVLFSASALAQPQTQTTAQANEGTTPDPQEVICVVEEETGTRLSKRRICQTRAQWEAYRQANRQVTERVQSNRTTSGQ